MQFSALMSRIPPRLLAPVAFAAAFLLALLVAWWGAVMIESRSVRAANSQLLTAGITWTEVSASGLQVRVHGTAPNEAARYRAINLIGTVVDSARIHDHLEVPPPRAIEAPRFSVEILRNDDGVSLIGLLPTPPRDKDAPPPAEEDSPPNLLAAQVAKIARDVPVSNMLEAANFPPPETWDAAVTFGLAALELLPRAKISVAQDVVAVTAIAESEAQKRDYEARLRRATPKGVEARISISAPRPVLTPFTLRFVIDADGPRFDACSADTERARDRILAAAKSAGLTEAAPCTIGLGVPSPSWGEATATAIAALAEIGKGSVTFSDADVSLLADAETTQAVFDRVVGELQASLPRVFSLKATLQPKPTAVQEGPAELTADLSADGRVVVRGRLVDNLQKSAVESFAKARFGAGRAYIATRFDPGLPEGWPLRVLAGLESLSLLTDGKLTVRADLVEVTGVTGDQGARARITQLLSDKLGQGQTFRVSVRYDEALDPLAALPTPQECLADMMKVLAGGTITFTPGSAEISPEGQTMIGALSKVMEACPPLELEVAGHTDAQGSTSGNQALSQARAEAVVLALQGRRVDVSGMVAKGYGEGVPVADNGTEEGREANRRIEFTLLNAAVPAASTAETQPEAQTEAPRTAGDGAAPDFSADTSPSLAPANDVRPRPRPARD